MGTKLRVVGFEKFTPGAPTSTPLGGEMPSDYEFVIIARFERVTVEGPGNAEIEWSGDLARIMRDGEELRDGCGKKRAIHVANRCSNELRRVSTLRHSRHELRYAASLRPSICRAQETHN